LSATINWRPAQTGDQTEDAVEDLARQGGLRELEDGVAGVPHQPRAGLDQPLAQTGQRPGLDGRRRRQRAQEVRQVVGQCAELEPHGVGREAHAGEPRPLERVFALLDELLGRAAEASVERLDEGVFGRLSGPGEVQRDAVPVGPEVEIAGDALAALVDADRLRIADLSADPPRSGRP
jgi:hypothetical protein